MGLGVTIAGKWDGLLPCQTFLHMALHRDRRMLGGTSKPLGVGGAQLLDMIT